MTGRVQTLRSSVAGNRPTGRQPGELYVNWADNQLGVINASNAAQDLIAVRFFSSLSSYTVGSYVIQAGQLYSAKVAVSAGTFNPAQWLLAGGNVIVQDTPPSTPQSGTLWWDSVGGQLYVYYTDANSSQWVVVVSGGPVGSTTLPLMNGTAAIGNGAMWARNDHVHPTDTSLYSASNPAGYQTAAQVTASLGGYLPLTGGVLTGNLSLGVATPQFILNKPAAGTAALISGQTNGATRWVFVMGDSAAESGSNAGSNFALQRYADNGTILGTAIMSVTRSTGVVSFPVQVVLSAGWACNATLGVINNANGMNYGQTTGMVLENTSNPPLYTNKIGANGTAISIMQGGVGCGSISVANSNATAFNTSSDVRLKVNERSFDAGPVIDAIQVYDFEWANAPGIRACGVMAQETNEVFPDAVTYSEQDDWWGVDYSKFVPLLLQEIKALRERVATLEAGR